MEITVGKTRVTVACTWGEAEDVYIGIHFDPKISSMFRDGNYRSLGMTEEQADCLGHYLLQAASHAREMEQFGVQYDEELERLASPPEETP